jgi:hypothetical protein
MCLACADAWLSYAVTERGALFLQFSSKLLVERSLCCFHPTHSSGPNHTPTLYHDDMVNTLELHWIRIMIIVRIKMSSKVVVPTVILPHRSMPLRIGKRCAG